LCGVRTITEEIRSDTRTYRTPLGQHHGDERAVTLLLKDEE
jgi:hypothetical protein